MKSIMLSIAIVLFVFINQASAQKPLPVEVSNGETVYVSIYSDVLFQANRAPHQLAATLCLRNTDPKYGLTITRADYYDTDGKLVERHIKKPLMLKPLSSKYIRIDYTDKKGGEGANFLVSWSSAQKINQPIIEGLMLNLLHGQGVAIRCPGQRITEHK